jgi:hypothetical protein
MGQAAQTRSRGHSEAEGRDVCLMAWNLPSYAGAFSELLLPAGSVAGHDNRRKQKEDVRYW